ncbi:MAG: family 43 glycosylhydrolase [Eubacteriales bacterium]|nr:family 43 glycosylhydrolase [Eubacteriales bacterium]
MQAVNPYLPSWEYIPDGEPHLFGDRIYVYGSHDKFGAPVFCVNDYVCWSASVDNLADWRCEGVIYTKKQDPVNRTGLRCLYAPDVTRGPDGRYYLYYAFDFLGRMGVAVCDTPAGKYEYLGHVRFPDGHEWGTRSGEPFPFDPGVLMDDDGRVYLYSGFATKVPRVLSRGHDLTNEGGVVLELEPDMVTIKAGPELLFPRKGGEGAFGNHAFFEASSIRKIDGSYYFVYSSEHNHELCYAVGTSPRGPFVFGGTLVDLGDLYLNQEEDERKARNYLGNTHGGMVRIENDWYIFYHRQTNRNSYCRQACAERLHRRGDGGFDQAEVTSCGLNGGPLRAEGRYEARIACNLWSGEGTGRYDTPDAGIRMRKHLYFTQTGGDREDHGDQYIANMRDGATAGFKYFQCQGVREIEVEINGRAKGTVTVSTEPGGRQIAAIPVQVSSGQWKKFRAPVELKDGKYALYVTYQGKGRIGFKSLLFIC